MKGQNMLLRYALPDGAERTFKLEKRKITLGRGLKVDLTIHDRLASRLHCCIEFKDGGWHITDLNSRNGIFVNDERVVESPLAVGDRIRIGTTTLVCEKAVIKGAETVIRELKNEMDGGKGYRTMLIEIVEDGLKKTPMKNTDQFTG